MAIEFSDWLNKKMIEKGLNPTQLARKSTLSRQAIHYYLSGQSKQPDEFALKKLAKALDVTYEEALRAVGILPPISKDDEVKEALMDEFSEMSKDEQKEALAIIKALNKVWRNK